MRAPPLGPALPIVAAVPAPRPLRRTYSTTYNIIDVRQLRCIVGSMSWPIRSMSLVVGGIVRPDDVVGRYRDAEAVAAALPHSGAVLVGDRRHGKTSLARVVQRNAAAAGAVVIATSAQRATYGEF